MLPVNKIARDIAVAELTEKDIERLWSLLKEKSKDLMAKNRILAKATLIVGTEVETHSLRPKALSGLRGKITNIGNTRLDIELDKDLPVWHPATKHVYNKMLKGIPLTCVKEI